MYEALGKIGSPGSLNDGARLAAAAGAAALTTQPIQIEQDGQGEWHVHLTLPQLEARGSGPTHQEAISELLQTLTAYLPDLEQPPEPRETI